MSEGLIVGDDGLLRCRWSGSDPLYQRYHDLEWGRPVADDVRLFEKLSLEGFQAGLSWITILRKRENFRAAFEGFDISKVAGFGAPQVKRLLGDTGIVRHRGKIESTINNARRALELIEEEGSLARFYWSFEPTAGERPGRIDWATVKALAQTEASARLSKTLRKRGFSFVGPTTAYAFMQAMGLVNDHVEGCVFRDAVLKARARFKRPARAGRSSGSSPGV